VRLLLPNIDGPSGSPRVQQWYQAATLSAQTITVLQIQDSVCG